VEITEVRVKLMEEPGERLQAFCSITFDDAFVVRDLKIIEGATGPFVAMPSRKLTGHCPQCRCKNHLRAGYCNQCGARLREQRTLKDDDGRAKLYADIAHPINSSCREMIQQRVIEAFQEEKSRAKLPGYVPSYEDFDQEEPAAAWTPPPRPAPPSAVSPAPPRPAVESTQIQAAEKPRGPHKVPATQPQQDGHAHGSFGAGIFE
jgi:stage V sporulation protein G